MKKTLLTLFTVIILCIVNSNLQAQEVRNPIDPKEKTEIIPVSPGDGWSWVKAHWEWDGGRYKWKKGMFIETRKGYVWMDGEWERNQKSGWWKYNEGYWQKEGELSEINNDSNTAKEDKESKEKRQQNKVGGLFIKTGASK